MRAKPLVVYLLIAVLVGACAGPGATVAPTATLETSPSEPASTSPTPQPSPSIVGQLKVGFPSTPDAGDTPMLLAFERLNRAGWEIEPVFFAQPEAAFAALASGQVQVGVGAVSSALAAIQSGGQFRIIAEQEGIPWSVVAVEGINRCDDLVGKRFALHSPGGTTTTYANYWISENCSPEAQKGIKPIYIAGSENRAAALLAGQIDATLLTSQDIALLNEKAPGKFHSLVNFGESSSLAQVNSSVIAANTSYLASYGDVLAEFLKAIMQAYRDADADPSVLRPIAQANNISWTDAVEASVRLELENGTLDRGLEITPESINFTIQFFSKYGDLRPGLTVDGVADFTVLQAVSASG